MLRKALIKDVDRIHELINLSAANGEMLPRSLSEIYDNIRDFFVYEVNGGVVGVCALHIFWQDLAEIRSLCVEDKWRGKGIGSKLVNACLKEAYTFGLRRIFLLTYRKEFFGRFGFELIDRNELPQKIWTDCVKCPKFPRCDEVAMIRTIGDEKHDGD